MFSSFLFLYVFLFKLVLGLSFFDQSKSFLYSSFKLQEAVLFVGHASASFLGLIFFLLARRTLPKRRDYLQSNVALYMMIVVMIMI